MPEPRDRPWFDRRRCRIVALAAGACGLLSLAGCAREEAVTIDPGKVATVQIGRSSRADVFATLGRPVRTERSTAGERWIYESGQPGQGHGQLLSGVGAASGIVGAFVPFVGLVGPGLGLADAASGTRAAGAGANLAVEFDADGVVRDCLYASGAVPAGAPGTLPPLLPACGRARGVPER